MMVPEFWAEARAFRRLPGRKRVVRRFGWSNVSMTEAAAMAEARLAEALGQLDSGAGIHGLEPKAAYNGADGVPIREEIVSRHGEEVVTRNAYGALCLNSPRALFADVDFERPGIGARLGSWIRGLFQAPQPRIQDPSEGLSRQRIEAFLSRHPDWAVRLYRTPNGLRILATHRPFSSSDPEVAEFFDAVGCDPVYVRMCRNQRCFRARLTAKPWRAGIDFHIPPCRGVWPVRPENLPRRREWVAEYGEAAARHSACHWIDSLGSGRIDPGLRPVVELHDSRSQALRTDLPLA